jgi:hypothetical protein
MRCGRLSWLSGNGRHEFRTGDMVSDRREWLRHRAVYPRRARQPSNVRRLWDGGDRSRSFRTYGTIAAKLGHYRIRLILDLVRQQLECRHVDEVEASASGALNGFVLLSLIISGRGLTFDGTLGRVASSRAAIEEGPRHCEF